MRKMGHDMGPNQKAEHSNETMRKQFHSEQSVNRHIVRALKMDQNQTNLSVQQDNCVYDKLLLVYWKTNKLYIFEMTIYDQ